MCMSNLLARASWSCLLAAAFGSLLAAPRPAAAADCAPDNGGLTLPADLCATVFADNIGQARHLAVTGDGTVYVNTWRSPYKPDAVIAFIAFHGSWNRMQQQGYNVVFVPMTATGALGRDYEVFADGFAGPVKTPDGAAHRPSGLAVGPDGALYVSDDQRGRVWRITTR